MRKKLKLYFSLLLLTNVLGVKLDALDGDDKGHGQQQVGGSRLQDTSGFKSQERSVQGTQWQTGGQDASQSFERRASQGVPASSMNRSTSSFGGQQTWQTDNSGFMQQKTGLPSQDRQGQSWQDTKGRMKDNTNQLWQDNKQQWQDAKERVKDNANQRWQDAKEQWQGTKADVKDDTKQRWQGAKQQWQDTKDRMQDNTQQRWQDAKEQWQGTKADVKDDTKQRWQGAKQQWQDTKDRMQDNTQQRLQDAKEQWQGTKADVKDDTNQRWQGAKQQWQDTKDRMQDNTQQRWQDAKEQWQDTKADVKDDTKQRWQGAKQQWQDTKDRMQDNTQQRWQDAKEQWRDTKADVKDDTNQRWQGAKQQWQDSKGQWQDNRRQRYDGQSDRNWQENNKKQIRQFINNLPQRFKQQADGERQVDSQRWGSSDSRRYRHHQVYSNYRDQNRWFKEKYWRHHRHDPSYYRYYSQNLNWWQVPSPVFVTSWLGWRNQPYYRSGYVVDMNVEWLPLGIFAIISDERRGYNPTMFIQLAIARDGSLAGIFYNAANDVVYPLTGFVDEASQRAVWKIAEDPYSPLVEAGLYDLTQDEAPTAIYFPNGVTETGLLVRLQRD